MCHQPPGGGGTLSWVGACGSLPKTLTLLMIKICYCCYPIYDLPKIPYRIYDLCSWNSCPKHTVLLIMMKKTTHGLIKHFLYYLTFRMLQHTSSEVNGYNSPWARTTKFAISYHPWGQRLSYIFRNLVHSTLS